MPTVLRLRGRRYFFYSNEGTEPPHVHVEQAGNTAKFWLAPVECADNRGFSTREITALVRIIIVHEQEFEEAWHEHFDA